MTFKSVTKIATDQYAPATGAANSQYWQIYLHGSGGGNFTFGDSYTAVCDTTMGYLDNMVLNFHVRNLDTYQHLNPHIELEPVDKVALPAGGTMESFWFGYTFPEVPKRAHPYTEAELDTLYADFLVRYPQASRTRAVMAGNSMGAWGCISYGLRHQEKYAAVFATLARWRSTDLNDIATGYGIPQPNVLMADGSGQTFAQRMDMVTYVTNPANKLPFIAIGTGRQDIFCPWQQHMDAIAALRATKRAFVFSWNNGDHSSATATSTMAAIESTYDRSKFELGVGYPVLMNSSLDNPLTDLVGGINLGFKWRNVVESASAWSCEISNTLGACAVDVLPRSDIFTATVAAKSVSIPAGAWMAVSFSSGGVQPPPDPVIVSFTAVPAGTTFGQSAVLDAVTTDAVSLTIDGIAATLPMTVTPAATHTYTLTAIGAAGTNPATATATITVSATVDPCQSVINERDAALAKIAAAVAILTDP